MDYTQQDHTLRQDFLPVPDYCVDVNFASLPKFLDPANVPIMPDTPFRVTELAEDLIYGSSHHSPKRLQPQVISDQVQNTQGDEVPQDLLQDVEALLSLQPMFPYIQETQVMLDVPQGLFSTQETAPPPQQPMVALQEAPELPPAVSTGAGGHSPTSPSTEQQRGSRSRRRTLRAKTLKMYEVTEEFEDPDREKKRRDAINSKRNRDRKAQALTDLRKRVGDYTAERDRLLEEVQALKQREMQLLQQLQSRPTHPQTSFAPPSPHSSAPSSPPPYQAHHLTFTPPATPHFMPVSPNAQ